MPDTYIVNPLSKDSHTMKEEEPDAGSDISLCCLSYFFCCIPLLTGAIR